MLFCLIVAMNVVHIYAQDEIEARVVNGNMTVIEQHPYCAFLSMIQNDKAFICGASILNQRILLSAAHCFEGLVKSDRVTAFIGNTDRREGSGVKVAKVKMHPDYNPEKFSYDIAIAGLSENLQLGETISKVSLVRSRPELGIGIIAGWGLFNEDPVESSYLLHTAIEKFWPQETCESILLNIPVGTFCAGKKEEQSYPSFGDSGSPFVIDGYIQIGLVSYKKMQISKSIIIYTDVSFYYDWIKESSKNVYCQIKS